MNASNAPENELSPLVKLVIRKTDDLELIHELDRKIFSDSTPITERELEATDWWVVWARDEPVGFAGVRLFYDRASLIRAGVLPDVRGAGMQKRLIRLRVRYAKRHGLQRCYTYCWAGNIASMRSLISCGFKPYRQVMYPAGRFIFFETQRRIKSSST